MVAVASVALLAGMVADKTLTPFACIGFSVRLAHTNVAPPRCRVMPAHLHSLDCAVCVLVNQCLRFCTGGEIVTMLILANVENYSVGSKLGGFKFSIHNREARQADSPAFKS